MFLIVPESISDDLESNDTYYYYYDDDYYIPSGLKTAPILINITFLSCPPGFTLQGVLPGCDCHPVLKLNDVTCILKNIGGYHRWNSSIWIQTNGNSNIFNTLSFSRHCPYELCFTGEKILNLQDNPDDQCTFNHAGILCGGCRKNYSLAIGSSHCIYCPNNNLALLIFFAAAGVLMVVIIVILNITVTQGMINSLVLYANIIWAYQNILFPPGFSRELIAHKTFIAWLNMDFGIETCFISGMNAYTKTWLQFVFPFYTAGLFFLGLRYSSKLAKFFGSRSVPTLATLLLLSHSKLLRTIIACLQLAVYYIYYDSNVEEAINVVWAVDGNLSYGQYPHIFLLLAAIACLILLWVPYTLLLFSMQWLRRVDQYLH